MIVLRASHHPAHRSGGWAWVRLDPGQEPLGQAGGARHIDAGRAPLLGLVAALKDAPKGPLALDLADPRLAALLRRLAEGPPLTPDEAPTEDLDLWAPLSQAVAGRALTRAANAAAAAFAQAWADLARDKAKAQGPFASPIPRPNLAKLKA